MKTMLLLATCVIGLSSCAGRQAVPPAMPSIADVGADVAQLETITDPAAFYRVSTARILMGCMDYFDKLVLIAQKNAQASSQITAATQAASAILGLAQAAPGPISAIGVVGPAIAGAIANTQASMPGGDHPAETSTLVAAMMNAYLAAIGSPPADAPSAWLAAYGLFRTCSPAGIEAAKQQALADAPNHLVVTPMAASQQLAPAAVAPRAPGMGIPQVMIRTPPPAPFSVPMMVSQALPEPKIRERLSNEHALIRRYGRNLVEGGPQAPPTPIVPPSPPVELTPLAPPSVAEQPTAEPMAVAPLPPSSPSPLKRKL